MIDLSSTEGAARAALDVSADLRTVTPHNAHELAGVLKEATQAGEAVTPWGGGTEQQLGAPPARCDLLMDLRRLAGIDFYRPEDLTLGVRAGTTLAEVAAALAEHGQFLPLDLPCALQATIGGVIATAAAPVRRFRYGGARDLVIGLEVALADGMLCKSGGRVVKNVAGYDLCKLYTGSLGTLGVLTGVNLKVQPLPRHRAVTRGSFTARDDALRAGGELVRTGLAYGTIAMEEAHDPHTVTLTVLAEGFSGAVARQVAAAERAMLAQGGEVHTEDGAEAGEAATRALADWRAADRGAGGVVLRGSAPPSQLGVSLASVLTALASTYRVPGLQADVGMGTFFLRAMCDAGSGSAGEQSDAIRRARTAAQNTGAHLVLAAGPAPLRRAVDPWGAPADGERLARALKEQLDPAGTLNPGRFAYGI